MDSKRKQGEKASEHQNWGHNQDQHISNNIKNAVSAQGADAHERRQGFKVLAKGVDTHKIGEHIGKSQDKCHTEGDLKESESCKKEESSSDEESVSDSKVSSDEEESEESVESNHNGCSCYSEKCDYYPHECQLFYIDDG